MAQNTRGDEKQLRRDQQVRREVQQEVGEEIRSSDTKPLIRQPNRDQARGDWDRTGNHHDVGTSRAPDDDEGFDERS
jgi:hypothetical protein